MNSTLYRDAIFNVLLAFMFCVIIMLPHLNPPASTKQADPPGNLIVHVVWPTGDTDVDLWLSGPGEPRPVGYSNKGGVLWNLLRDDLGTQPDATPFNYENAFTRGIVPGEYTINVHCYRCPIVPIPVQVEVSLNPSAGQIGGKSASIIILNATAELRRDGEEKTVVNFVMDAKGNIDPESMNSIQKKLRDAVPSGNPGGM